MPLQDRAPQGDPDRSSEIFVLGRGRTFAMAAAAGLAIASIYYNQPMLDVIEQELVDRVAGAVPTATQLGYAAGLFLLVPLGDLVERKRLIVLQFSLLAIALALAALAPNGLTLVAASLAVGLLATVAQQIVPLAAHLAAPPQRGATVGTVMAGLLTGILLSRTLAGFVAAHAGWRTMFWLSVPLALAGGGLMAVVLPRSRPDSLLNYPKLLHSIWHLWRSFPTLRLAALTQSALFAAFIVFWTVLAFRLAEPRFGFGAEVAGLFGLVGAIGILAAPLAGRFADRRGPSRAVILGVGVTVAAWLVFGLWSSLAGLVAGVVLLDLGIQMALVSNQHIVFALQPDARARLNTVLMGTMFLGGALGSALGTLAWQMGAWPLVSALGTGFSLLAAILQGLARRRRA